MQIEQRNDKFEKLGRTCAAPPLGISGRRRAKRLGFFLPPSRYFRAFFRPLHCYEIGRFVRSARLARRVPRQGEGVAVKTIFRERHQHLSKIREASLDPNVGLRVLLGVLAYSLYSSNLKLTNGCLTGSGRAVF